MEWGGGGGLNKEGESEKEEEEKRGVEEVRGRILPPKGARVDKLWGVSELWKSDVNGGRREKVVSVS